MTQKTNYGITTADTDIVKQLQEIYKKLGIPLNGMSKELYCHSEASCAAIQRELSVFRILSITACSTKIYNFRFFAYAKNDEQVKTMLYYNNAEENNPDIDNLNNDVCFTD